MTLRRMWGELIVPALAIVYAAYAWWEQSSGSYRADTILYMQVLIVPVVGLALARIARSVYAAWRASRDGHPQPRDPDTHNNEGKHSLRPVLFICASTALVFTIDWLGYLVAFALLVPTLLAAMGVRSLWRIVIVTAVTLLMLQFVFIELLDLPLPRGLTAELVKLP